MTAELHPIKIKATNEEEEYILEEARIWLQENMFSSIMNPNNPHISNVVALGKKHTPFLMEFLRENDHPQGMYTHFLLDVIFRLYKDEIKVNGYLGVDGCTKLLLKVYDSGMMADFISMDDEDETKV
jgi:hypothetical protein